MLTRAILDHVPPVFGVNTFAEVAINHGGRSLKEAMSHLENGSRKIADLSTFTQRYGTERVFPT
jgi:hypothetical protein